MNDALYDVLGCSWDTREFHSVHNMGLGPGSWHIFVVEGLTLIDALYDVPQMSSTFLGIQVSFVVFIIWALALLSGQADRTTYMETKSKAGGIA